MRTKFVWGVVLILIVGLLGACGGDDEEAGGIPEDAALKVTGQVNQDVGWTEDEVRAMETIEAESTNKSGEASTYTGVPLNTLLDLAGVKSDASAVVFVRDDGYEAEAALDEVRACQDCIASFRNKGGFSIVMPEFPSDLQVKGVIEIRVK